jgi:Ca2+-binding RTX toxin-like protein
MFFGLIALILFSVVAAFAAGMIVTPTNADNIIVTLHAEDLKPSVCTMTLTNIVRGAGTITGTSNNELILGSSGSDIIDAGGGDDCILGAAGDDNINGGDGDDHILGGDGDDSITGGDGNDHIIGGNGNDTCTGELGTDSFETCETVTDP